MNRDGYRDQIVTCDVGVSLHSKTHPLFYEVEQWHKHTVLCISLSELVSCAFSTIPICPFFNSKNFSFTCNTLSLKRHFILFSLMLFAGL